MKIFIATITIFLPSLISSSRAKALILSNQKDTGQPGCVKCPKKIACVHPGNETSIELPNNTALCWGSYYSESEYTESDGVYLGYHWSRRVYNSREDFDKFKDKIIVKINDTSFYRSNEENKAWEEIPSDY